MAILKQLQEIEKKQLVNFKASATERKIIQKNADKFANGNISAWIRYAATKLEPKKSDLIEI